MEKWLDSLAGLWADVKDNVMFLLVAVAVAAALVAAARIAEHYLPTKRKVSPAKRITVVAVCSAIATLLHILDFPLPFLAPGFYKLDFSELPVMLCGFYLGPSATIICEFIKIILKLLLVQSSTMFVGDFANFVVGCSLVLPATIIYHIRKSKRSALWGLLTGTLCLTVFGSAFNAFYLLPTFCQLFYGNDMSQIIDAGSAVNPWIQDIPSFVLLAVAPLNLIKGVAISLLTLLLYKRVARPLFGK